MSTVSNWAETHTAHPHVLVSVASVDQLADALNEAAKRASSIRILGAAQSPNDMAMSDETLIAIRGLDQIRSIDRDRCVVVAESGITLAALAAALAPHGLALPNLGSIARQTLGGAVATGAHGTGLGFGSLSTWVDSFEMLTVDGTLMNASRTENPDLFAAGCLSLGSLGVHTAFSLKVVPDFDLEVEEGPIPLEEAMQPTWYATADHARVWYLPDVPHAWGWRAKRVPPCARAPRPPKGWIKDRLVGYHAFQTGLWLAASFPRLLPLVNRAYSKEFLTAPRRSAGGNVEEFTFDCLFHQHVTEWAVPLEHAADAAQQTRAMVEQGGFHAHLPIEIRFAAGDDIWLSPTQGAARCWIGILSYIPYGREVSWRPWFTAFEECMLGFQARPHWAKHFSAGPETFRHLYPQWQAFSQIRDSVDPTHRLRNAYTDRVLEP